MLTFIYQDGRLTGLLGYTPNGGIEPTDFLVTATLIFALSTDYGVFLLGRIKELRDGGLGERESVAVGVQRTGAVVTAAAILLAVAIGSFSTSSISFIQQIGVATAFGVLIDAFVVRSLLVPVADGPAREVELVGADAAAPAARPDRTLVRAVTPPSAAAYRPRVRMHPRTVAYDALPRRRARRDDGRRALEDRRAGHSDHAVVGRGDRRRLRAGAAASDRGPALALVLAMAGLYAVMAKVEIYQTVPFPSMVAGYSLALVSSRRTTILAGLALVPFVVGAIALFGHEVITTAELPKNLAFVAAPLLLGSAVRERRAAHEALVERAETAERTREEEALRRVGEERLRIARDVHDVVAHAMVAINVQAGVGAHLLDRDPERARRTLQDIKRLSGEALDDLRATLGTLRRRRRRGRAPVPPAQGLRELDDLGSASLRSAGVVVEVDIDPATRDPARLRHGHRLPDRPGGTDQRGPARERLHAPGARDARGRPGGHRRQ